MKPTATHHRVWALIAATSSAALLFAFGSTKLKAQSSPTGPTVSHGQDAGAVSEDPFKQIRGQLPDQAHAMMDVAFHFSGVWLAGQRRNWPLARFYYDETRSHLHWAVRVRPVRKTSAGAELVLGNILQALEAEEGPFGLLKASIEAKDSKKFQAAYRTALEACYACHKASEKPYLRPKIPTQMGDMINFDPAAKWPQ